jgi:hypothetical protein
VFMRVAGIVDFPVDALVDMACLLEGGEHWN